MQVEWKNIDGNLLVRIKKQAGWGKPIVDDTGRFYPNSRVAAEVFDVSDSTVRNAIRHNFPLRGPEGMRSLFFAKEEDVVKNGGVACPSADSTNMLARSPESADRVIKRLEASGHKPFTAVRWPDGWVTVRFTAGGQWSMTRRSEEELPSEIATACAWIE